VHVRFGQNRPQRQPHHTPTGVPAQRGRYWGRTHSSAGEVACLKRSLRREQRWTSVLHQLQQASLSPLDDKSTVEHLQCTLVALVEVLAAKAGALYVRDERSGALGFGLVHGNNTTMRRDWKTSWNGESWASVTRYTLVTSHQPRCRNALANCQRA